VDEEGRIWVGADEVVAAFDTSGKRVAEIPIEGKATALATDRGWLWVGVTDHVEMFSLETLQRVDVGEVLPEGARLTSLAPAFQSLWAADAANRLVLLLNRDGDAIAVLASVEYAEAHRFAVPSPYFDVAEDADERLLVTDPGRHRVEIWEQGERVGYWGRAGTDPAGFAGCCGPANFAVLPDGGIAAVDKGMPRLKVYEPDGTLRAMIADETRFAEFSRACDARTAGSIALDVAVTGTGRIVILEPCTGRLRFFDPPARPDEP